LSGLDFGTSGLPARAQLYNQGSAPATPVYTFVGPLTTPTLSSSLGAFEMTYNDVIAAGHTVVVDPTVRSVLVDDTVSQRWKLNPSNFSGFVIPAADQNGPGYLSVGLSHAGPLTDAGYVQIDYRDTWF
jgi:hypothetical protein